MESFDVIVVGARCAGATIATHLARAGMRTCLIDRAKFPSETPSTHVIQPRGVDILAELGLLDSVLATGAAPLTSFSFVNDDVRIDSSMDSFDHPGLCVRRITLDSILLDGAARAGVDVRIGVAVDALRMLDGRVVGVETADGPLLSDLVIGADGRGSVVAKSVRAREYLAQPPGKVPIWGYFDAGSAEPRLRVGRIGALGLLSSPTDSGLFMACVAVDHSDAHDFLRDREVNYRNALRAWPELFGIVDDTERVGPLRVMANWHSYFRESAGPGWALVGDAGQFKDFTPAQGIADAMGQARSLATAIVSTRDSSTRQEKALRRWWRERDLDSADMYWLAAQMGRAGASSPLTTELLRCVARDPVGGATMLQVLNREVPSRKLFTPRRLVAASVAALRDHPAQRRQTFAEIGQEMAGQVRRTASLLRMSLHHRGMTR